MDYGEREAEPRAKNVLHVDVAKLTTATITYIVQSLQMEEQPISVCLVPTSEPDPRRPDLDKKVKVQPPHAHAHSEKIFIQHLLDSHINYVAMADTGC